MANSPPLDAVVVGAGPGGVATAYHLARGGARVALVSRGTSKHRHGGIVSALAADCLAGMELLPWLESRPRCQRVVLGGPRGSLAVYEVPGGQALAYAVSGAELSKALLGAARSAGVEVSLGVEVSGVAQELMQVLVHTDHGVMPTRLVVLAEGSEGRVASTLGLFRRPPEFLVAETEYEYDAGGVAELHYPRGTLPCLAWAYPSAMDSVTVGLSAYASSVEAGHVRMAQSLAEFAAERAYGGLGDRRWLETPSVQWLRSGLDSVTPFGDRLLLVGEAAGVVHPLTLEGLGAAMESGRIAAQHGLYALQKNRLAASELSAYARALRRRFTVEHRPARVLRAALHSERVLERIVGRAQRDRGFAALVVGLFEGRQSTLGVLTPANLARYLMWWRPPRQRPL